MYKKAHEILEYRHMYRLSCFPIDRNHVYLQLQTVPIQLIVHEFRAKMVVNSV